MPSWILLVGINLFIFMADLLLFVKISSGVVQVVFYCIFIMPNIGKKAALQKVPHHKLTSKMPRGPWLCQMSGVCRGVFSSD